MCVACTALVFAVASRPLAGQAKQDAASTAPSGAAAPVDESKILLPGAAASGSGTTVAATAPGTAAVGATQGGGVSTWDFVRMLLILAAVVGVIYLMFWLLRRGAGRKIQENDLIRVLGSRSLSSSRALHLVEVGARVYLIGSSDGGVELIAEITEQESLDAVRLKAAEQGAQGRRTFPQILSEIFRPAKGSFSIGEGIGILKGQRERLRKL